MFENIENIKSDALITAVQGYSGRDTSTPPVDVSLAWFVPVRPLVLDTRLVHPWKSISQQYMEKLRHVVACTASWSSHSNHELLSNEIVSKFADGKHIIAPLYLLMATF